MDKTHELTMADWRELMLAKRGELEALRHAGANGDIIRAKRAEVIEIQKHIDILMAEQAIEYQRIAAEVDAAQTASIAGEAAAAVSEAERLLGG